MTTDMGDLCSKIQELGRRFQEQKLAHPTRPAAAAASPSPPTPQGPAAAASSGTAEGGTEGAAASPAGGEMSLDSLEVFPPC